MRGGTEERQPAGTPSIQNLGAGNGREFVASHDLATLLTLKGRCDGVKVRTDERQTLDRTRAAEALDVGAHYPPGQCKEKKLA